MLGFALHHSTLRNDIKRLPSGFEWMNNPLDPLQFRLPLLNFQSHSLFSRHVPSFDGMPCPSVVRKDTEILCPVRKIV